MNYTRLAERMSLTPPEGTDAVAHVSALLTATRTGTIPLYRSGPGGTYIYSVIVQDGLLCDGWVEDILNWSFSAPTGYGYGYRLHDSTVEFTLSGALDRTRSDVLDQGDPCVFFREDAKGNCYLEPFQPLVHRLSVHADQAKGSWKRLNNLGEDVVVLNGGTRDPAGWLFTIEQLALEDYLVASSSSLIRLVDYKDPRVAHFNAKQGPAYSDVGAEIYLQTCGFDGKVTAARGFDVIRVNGASRTNATLRLQGKEPRRYVEFRVLDWKHSRIVDWSSDPALLGNYFVDSDYPYGTSPAFFKADVLSQYRVHPERFRVLPHEVQCVGAWNVRYDLNNEGQVHAYLVDLAHLPYEEQLRWKAYNEEPRTGISKRAYETDFEGRWAADYDALVSLRSCLESFSDEDSTGPIMWSLKAGPATRGLDVLGYVHVDNRKEFEDQLLTLQQLLVEGLHRDEINRLADTLGCRDKQLASIRQLGRVLDALHVDPAKRDTILEPLAELQRLRSSLVAHSGEATLPTDFRGFQRELLARCDVAMRTLQSLVKDGVFSGT